MTLTTNLMRAFALIGILALPSILHAKTYSKSTRIWNEYYPDHNCKVQSCARNVPPKALEAFLEKASYFYPGKLTSNKWIMVVDFTQHSKQKRGYLISTRTGKATAYHVSHGIGSADGRGKAVRFSNRNQSKMSSLGLYLTAETYHGKHGYSLRMDGKESSNSRARSRAIVIHGASYMEKTFINSNNRSGRSWGCPAVAQSLSRNLIDKLKGGSLYYIYSD
ncbi:MAG: hypothetical protein ACJAT2_003201 [Bacteriovoracaceae bacterium]|jgi:hypothetical protein